MQACFRAVECHLGKLRLRDFRRSSVPTSSVASTRGSTGTSPCTTSPFWPRSAVTAPRHGGSGGWSSTPAHAIARPCRAGKRRRGFVGSDLAWMPIQKKKPNKMANTHNDTSILTTLVFDFTPRSSRGDSVRLPEYEPQPLAPQPEDDRLCRIETGCAEDLGVLLVLAQFAVGVAEDAGVGVLHQEGQDAFLAPTSLGDVVLLDQGIFAMEGDRVEVQVEGMTTGQTEPAHGVEPAAHQLRVAD